MNTGMILRMLSSSRAKYRHEQHQRADHYERLPAPSLGSCAPRCRPYGLATAKFLNICRTMTVYAGRISEVQAPAIAAGARISRASISGLGETRHEAWIDRDRMSGVDGDIGGRAESGPRGEGPDSEDAIADR